jgi:hypothetical protein
MKSSIVWDAMPCSPLKINRYFKVQQGLKPVKTQLFKVVYIPAFELSDTYWSPIKETGK